MDLWDLKRDIKTIEEALNNLRGYL